MPSPDPVVVERQYWLDKLGIADDPNLSLADLRNKTAGAVNVHRSAVAGDAAGLDFLTQAEGDARYSQLINAIPLDSDVPLGPLPAGFVGTAGEASHGDHRHPMQAVGQTPILSGGNNWGMPWGRRGPVLNNNKAPMTPWPVHKPFTLKKLQIHLLTAQDTGNWKLAMYKSTNRNVPEAAAPYYESAAQSSLTAGGKPIVVADLVMDVGLYWLTFGGYAFTVTRGLPAGLQSGVGGGDAFYHMFADTADSSWNPGTFLANFNEATGAFPTDGVLDIAKNASSSFWFAFQGDPL